MNEALARQAARDLRNRWDLQQAPFLPYRETALGVLIDLAAMALTAAPNDHRPRVLDLAGGPGSLASRLRQAVPSAEVALMDLDPVLLEIARRADADEFDVIQGDLGAPDWVTSVEHIGPLDVVTVANALHSFTPERLSAMYDEVCSILTPGGALVVAEMMPADGIQVHFAGPDPMASWRAWWAHVLARPELEQAATHRRRLADIASVDFYPPVEWHLRAARASGFDARVAWQKGDTAVVIARRVASGR